MKSTHRNFTPSIFLAVIVSIVFAVATSDATAKTGYIPENFTELAERSSPAVVNIRTEKTVKSSGPVMRMPAPFGGQQDPFRDFFDKFFGEEHQRRFKQRSLGSGFMLDSEGYIVTNNHVIEDADSIKVKLKNGKEYDATIVGRDPNTDIALIKVEDSGDLPSLPLGDSDALKVGEWVIAIGSPFGLEQTVTSGIVSAKGRVIGAGPYDDFIQTDASINPGNSGGPLLNMKGEVIGMNTAIIASGQGIGFAVPVNMVKGIVAQLKDSGEVTRGWLGVGIQSLTPDMADYYGVKGGKGVLVAEVFEGDPADEAGIKTQDIIVSVNGTPVEDSRDLTNLIAALPVGSTAKVKVIRNGNEKTMDVRIAKRDDQKVASQQEPAVEENKLGIEVAELTPELIQRFGFSEDQGIVIVGVDPQGKAAEAGLQVGDLIREINHKPIKEKNDFNQVIQSAGEGETLNFFILRKNAGFLVVKVKM